MEALSATALLGVWEAGYGEPLYRRALLLLAAACPERSADELSKLPIGRRDALLLTLRERTFGPRLTCVTVCPVCSERLEFPLGASEIRTTAPEAEREELGLTANEYRVDFRLPCTLDLMAADDEAAGESPRSVLIRRCIRRVRRHEEEIAPDQVPADLVDAVVAGMAAHDPQADVQLALACSGCGHRWRIRFDIVSFFWTEIQTWALRLLQEVHQLASAYGWREADILAMNPLRRRLYLEMIGI